MHSQKYVSASVKEEEEVEEEGKVIMGYIRHWPLSSSVICVRSLRRKC